jgi:MscS family membrane protein
VYFLQIFLNIFSIIFIMSFIENIYYGNSVEAWVIAFAIIFGAFLLGKVVYWTIGKFVKVLASKTKSKLDDILVDMLEEPSMLAIILGGFWFAFNSLNFPEGVMSFFNHAINFAIFMNIAWAISRFVDAIFTEYLIPLAEKTESDFDDQILPIVMKGSNFIIWTLAIVIGLDNAGYNVGALLAGLGIGGLALAMAAKDTVANVFGGLMVFLDKPFKLKERIKISGFDGTVTEIGLRSTKIKTLAGTEVSIPNSTFTGSAIENISREPSRKVALNLGLVYDTSETDVEKAMDILRDIAAENLELIEESTPLGFNSFGDFSLGILFIYYIKKDSDILGTQTKINLEILKRFNKAKLGFAFPTQTIEIKK